MGVGRGFGKLLLFGEHAAVYGHPAVGIRLDDYLDVRLELDDDGTWSAPGLPEEHRDAVLAAVRSLPLPPAGATVTIGGTLPTGVGFGSSAAFCSALLRAHAPTAHLDGVALWAESHRVEHIFHGTPSGIDTGLALARGAALIETRPPDLPTRRSIRLPPAALLVGAVRRTMSAARLIAGIRERREADPKRVNAALARLGGLARGAAAAADADSIGRAAGEAQRLLAGLGLSTPQLDRLFALLGRHGSLGEKLSGAGGGGAFFAVFRDEHAAATAAAALRDEAAQERIELVYLRTLVIAPDQPRLN